jgi:hypothetical protein
MTRSLLVPGLQTCALFSLRAVPGFCFVLARCHFFYFLARQGKLCTYCNKAHLRGWGMKSRKTLEDDLKEVDFKKEFQVAIDVIVADMGERMELGPLVRKK